MELAIRGSIHASAIELALAFRRSLNHLRRTLRILLVRVAMVRLELLLNVAMAILFGDEHPVAHAAPSLFCGGGVGHFGKQFSFAHAPVSHNAVSAATLGTAKPWPARQVAVQLLNTLQLLGYTEMRP